MGIPVGAVRDPAERQGFVHQYGARRIGARLTAERKSYLSRMRERSPKGRVRVRKTPHPSHRRRRADARALSRKRARASYLSRLRERSH